MSYVICNRKQIIASSFLVNFEELKSDHYLNTITYNYTTYYPSGRTVLTGVSETGYIFQSMERLEREIAGNMPSQLDDFLGKLKDILDTTKKLSDKQLKDTEEKNKREEAKKLDELMNVPSIKSAYKDLEITNKKLIETADKLSNLDTFLNNTMELTNLKKEYNTIARECLIQLTKFRMSVQTWASEHPEYARVAEFALSGLEYTAKAIAVAGIITSFYVTAPMSVPMAIAGGALIISKTEIKRYIQSYICDSLVKYAMKQGLTLKEKQEFMETAKWIIDNIIMLRNAKDVYKETKSYKLFINPKPVKTYIPKIDHSLEIAHILRKASTSYYKTHKQKLIDDVLNILANE